MSACSHPRIPGAVNSVTCLLTPPALGPNPAHAQRATRRQGNRHASEDIPPLKEAAKIVMRLFTHSPPNLSGATVTIESIFNLVARPSRQHRAGEGAAKGNVYQSPRRVAARLK